MIRNRQLSPNTPQSFLTDAEKVYLVYLVCPICSDYLVSFVQPNTRLTR
jgi:hypothetical protein